MKIAFKEWAIIVAALGAGDQTVVLRKGGIHERGGTFRPEHSAFLLFPTRFHQQADSVIPAAARHWESARQILPPEDRVRIEFAATVAGWAHLKSIEDALSLRPFHIWKDSVIRDRFEWGGTQAIHALFLRVVRLPDPRLIPMRPAYRGCRSWIELDQEISIDGAIPVLPSKAFDRKLASFPVQLTPTRD